MEEGLDTQFTRLKGRMHVATLTYSLGPSRFLPH
jgi:hypothetical protein